MDWTDGYRTDINYTYGYYTEINPVTMRFMMLMAGVTPPAVSSACEVGYGQGLSINIHGAAENVAWTGTDFNPAQAGFAQEMAAVSGARVKCLADSFHDFCERPDLPEFDYIALHGIWSWVSPENQAAIVRLIDKKLRVGGALYISYNTNPGWAPFRPVRDLVTLYAEREGTGRDILSRVSDAFAFFEKLEAVNPAYLAAYPAIQKKFELFRGKDAAYLAHEFFNESWAPSNFQDMTNILQNARMTYVCPATPLMAIPALGLNEDQRKLISAISDLTLRETVLDFIRNTQFRKDYWIKGSRPMSGYDRMNALRAEQCILVAAPDRLTREIKTGSGNINLSEAAHETFLAVLGDGKVHSLGEIEKVAHDLAQKEDAPEGAAKENLMTLAQVLCVLIEGGVAGLAQKKQDAVKARPCSEKLNLFIENMAITNGRINFLASPVTGGGIQVPRFEMLFLLALHRGAKTVQSMAAFARDCLDLSGQKIIKDGNTIDDPEKTLEYLHEQAEGFNKSRLPILRNLLVA